MIGSSLAHIPLRMVILGLMAGSCWRYVSVCSNSAWNKPSGTLYHLAVSPQLTFSSQTRLGSFTLSRRSDWVYWAVGGGCLVNASGLSLQVFRRNLALVCLIQCLLFFIGAVFFKLTNKDRLSWPDAFYWTMVYKSRLAVPNDCYSLRV